MAARAGLGAIGTNVAKGIANIYHSHMKNPVVVHLSEVRPGRMEVARSHPQQDHIQLLSDKF